jgi:hypothetical protein
VKSVVNLVGEAQKGRLIEVGGRDVRPYLETSDRPACIFRGCRRSHIGQRSRSQPRACFPISRFSESSAAAAAASSDESWPVFIRKIPSRRAIAAASTVPGA